MPTFLDTVWGATHYHVKRGCAGYFDSLLPGPSAVQELLECFRREPSAAVRLVRGNDKKDPDAYRLADGGLDLARIRNDFADGYTIVLDNVERCVRTIGWLSQSIEVELNFPTQVNAYVTPPESRGFVPPGLRRRRPERRTITDAIREAAQRFAEPGYRVLASHG